jgi:hypothetical protein
MGRSHPPSIREKRGEMQATRTLFALPLLALLTYLAAMVPFGVFLARRWDVAAFVEPLVVVVVFNLLVRRSFPEAV